MQHVLVPLMPFILGGRKASIHSVNFSAVALYHLGYTEDFRKLHFKDKANLGSLNVHEPLRQAGCVGDVLTLGAPFFLLHTR